MVIAIDGPGGVGKSTVARAVAEHLDMGYLDSGAYYRAVALGMIRAGIDPADTAAVVQTVARLSLDFVAGTMRLDAADVADQIRTESVAAASSRVAVVTAVRDHVNVALRDWVRRHHGRAVVEGRDIGSVVFPNAALKVFLDARPEVRVERRAKDPSSEKRDPGAVSDSLRRRDHRDRTRRVAPLTAADDAVVIDTSDLGIDQVVARIVELASDPAS